MRAGTVTNRDAMITNEVRIAPSSTKLNGLANMLSERMIGSKRRGRGDSGDEGAEEKSDDDGWREESHISERPALGNAVVGTERRAK